MKNIMNTVLAAKKKNYIVPVIEAMPVCSMSALCVSVGGTGGGSGTGGGTLSFTPFSTGGGSIQDQSR